MPNIALETLHALLHHFLFDPLMFSDCTDSIKVILKLLTLLLCNFDLSLERLVIKDLIRDGRE